MVAGGSLAAAGLVLVLVGLGAMPFMGLGSAVARYTRAVSLAAISRIRLMVEYCAPFPVWGTYLRGPDHFVGPDRNPLGLSRDLIRDLIEWQRSWDRRYDRIDGWGSPAQARRHREVGADLYRRLREETGRNDITWE